MNNSFVQNVGQRQKFIAVLLDIIVLFKTGTMAKESVVSTLTILSAVNVLTPFTAAVFLVFTLLYTPCVAAIASVKRELGGKWAVFVVAIQCVIAWLVAFAVHLAGIGLGIG